MSRTIVSSALGLVVLLTVAGAPGIALAVDTVVTKNAPDLTAVRAKIKAKDFAGALTDLKKLSDTVQHADVYNLIGFTSRKTGDYKNAATFYSKALDFDANHAGALEYQGEMYVELGQIDKAKANLARLVVLCPTGCEERGDLERSIAAGPANPPKAIN